MYMPKPWENRSGLPDPTAYAATKAIMDEKRRVSELADAIRQIARVAGFEIMNRMEFESLESGCTYR